VWIQKCNKNKKQKSPLVKKTRTSEKRREEKRRREEAKGNQVSTCTGDTKRRTWRFIQIEVCMSDSQTQTPQK
jgi:hypothetical protein